MQNDPTIPAERTAFEEWAANNWPNMRMWPQTAWEGWQARAAYTPKPAHSDPVADEARAREVLETMPFERFEDRDVRFYARRTVLNAMLAFARETSANAAVPATNQAGEVERIARYVRDIQADVFRGAVDPVTAIDAIRDVTDAALATQPATSQEGEREAIARIIAPHESWDGHPDPDGMQHIRDTRQAQALAKADRILALTTAGHDVRALREALAGITDDYMTSETHHPGYVLIPTAKFDQLREAGEKV